MNGIAWSSTGADPGIFVRGGRTCGNFWQVLFPFLQKYCWNPLSRQLFTYKLFSVGDDLSFNCKALSLYTHRDDIVVFILWLCHGGGGGGGLGALPQKIFGLNGVKLCNSRPKNMKNLNALSKKQGRECWIFFSHNLDKGNIEKGWPFHTEH